MVVAIEPACVVEQRVLRSEDPTATQNGEGPRNSAGSASLPPLRRTHPLGPTPTASETLGGIGTIGRSFEPCLANVRSLEQQSLDKYQSHRGTVGGSWERQRDARSRHWMALAGLADFRPTTLRQLKRGDKSTPLQHILNSGEQVGSNA